MFQSVISWVGQQGWLPNQVSVEQMRDSTISIMLHQALQQRQALIQEIIGKTKTKIIFKAVCVCLFLCAATGSFLLSWVIGISCLFISLGYVFSLLIDITNIQLLRREMISTNPVYIKRLF